MKLIVDIDDKRIKGIKLLAKEQDIATPYPTLEQIIANGIPLDEIKAEIEAIDTVKVKLGDCMNIIKSPQRIKDEVLEIIDKYKVERSE